MRAGSEDSGADALGRTLTAFQSLGDNCEFGLVQRYVGAEPLGLFRFNNTALGALIEALDTDFRHYGEPGDLDIFVGPLNYLSCYSRRHGFIYSTGEHAGSIDPDVQRQREYKKLAYLKRRLMEDLAAGEQILVRKGRPDECHDDVLNLARAVRRHGPSTLLRVRIAEAGEEPGSVRWVSDGVMEGLVRRFSPYEGGMDIDLEPWIALCRNAHWLAQGRSGTPPPLRIVGASVRPADRVQPHLTPDAAEADDRDRARPSLVTRTAAIRAGQVGTDAVVTFSAWVWIPKAFDGERFGAVLGTFGLAWGDADLSQREAWQRVWVSARVPKHGRLRAGFGTAAPGGQRFWSTDWRLSEGPIPDGGEPPSLTVANADEEPGSRIGDGIGRWLSGLTR